MAGSALTSSLPYWRANAHLRALQPDGWNSGFPDRRQRQQIKHGFVELRHTVEEAARGHIALYDSQSLTASGGASKRAGRSGPTARPARSSSGALGCRRNRGVVATVSGWLGRDHGDLVPAQ